MKDQDEGRRRRDAECNRDALLDAALATLAADADSGLEVIAAAARLSRRTVYSHFASRQHLIAALADRAGDALADVVRGVRDTTPATEHPLVTLARLEVHLWRNVERQRLLFSLSGRREHRARAAQHTDEVRALRIELVDAGRRLGYLRSGVPADVVARLLEAVSVTAFDAVAEGTLDAEDAARVAALTALAMAGADPSDAEALAEVALSA